MASLRFPPSSEAAKEQEMAGLNIVVTRRRMATTARFSQVVRGVEALYYGLQWASA